MKTIFSIVSLFLLVFSNSVFARQFTDLFGDYLGQAVPKDTPVVFAPGIISLPNRNESNIVFSPDGTECYFNEWAKDYSYAKIYCTKYIDKKWTPQLETSFSVGHKTSGGFLSADGNRFYFHYANYSGSEPYDIWMVKRTSQGWSDPIHLSSPINSDYRDGSYSETVDSIAYFMSNRPGGLDAKGDIWCANLKQGKSLKTENLGTHINSGAWDAGPCVANDGSYLIFTSERPGKIGVSDLYIIFKKEDGNWSEPINMEACNARINIKKAGAGSPTLSPDGRFLFFSRLDDIYWVSTSIIEKLQQTLK